MTTKANVEDFSRRGRRTYRLLASLWHYLTFRFLLVLGIVVFLMTVSLDALHNPASAAAISSPELETSALTMISPPRQMQEPATPQTLQNTYLAFDPETSEPLSRSRLTSASFISSRLTRAHLFTEQIR